MYVPRVLGSTDPDEETVSPPSEVAPASVYVEPSSTVAGLSPRIVMTGKAVSGGVTGAKSASLTIMVGGEIKVFRKAKYYFY